MSVTSYPLAVMHDYQMALPASLPFLSQVARGEIDKLSGIDSISKNRRALLSYGAAVLLEIIEAMKPSRIVISAIGVREGFLYSLLSPDEQARDPLIAAAEELALLRARSVTHAHELADWTGAAFAAFGIEETDDEARYRRAACLLTDIGWRAHPDYRGTQSLNIIAHASFIGIDHPGRAFLALTSLYRHEGLSHDPASPEMRTLATPHYAERARLLGGLMRVVILLSAAMPGIIPTLRWETRDGVLTLIVPPEHAGLMGERPEGRINQLAKILGKPLAIALGA